MSEITYRVRVEGKNSVTLAGVFKTYEGATRAIEQKYNSLGCASTVYYIESCEETNSQRIVTPIAKISWTKTVTPVFDPPRYYRKSEDE